MLIGLVFGLLVIHELLQLLCAAIRGKKTVKNTQVVVFI